MIFDKKEDAIEEVARIISQGKRVFIKASMPRTISQNDYFHGIICPIFAISFGLTKAEAKQIFKNEFLTYDKLGKEFTKSTSELNKDEFSNFIDECLNFAANHNCYIPSSDEISTEIIHEINKHKKYL